MLIRSKLLHECTFHGLYLFRIHHIGYPGEVSGIRMYTGFNGNRICVFRRRIRGSRITDKSILPLVSVNLRMGKRALGNGENSMFAHKKNRQTVSAHSYVCGNPVSIGRKQEKSVREKEKEKEGVGKHGSKFEPETRGQFLIPAGCSGNFNESV